VHPIGTHIPGTSLVERLAPPSADFNSDGRVDSADYVIWRKADGTQQGYDTWRANIGATVGTGDFNGDGAVNAADYIMWRNSDSSQLGYDNWRANFGEPAGRGASFHVSVPEPASAILLLLLAVLGSCTRIESFRLHR
jgi:hypothetical protein